MPFQLYAVELDPKKLNRLSETKSTVNQDYISLLSSFIASSRVIKNYHIQTFFYTLFQQKLSQNIEQNMRKYIPPLRNNKPEK